MPMYVVYILYSKKLNRFYTGTTDDFERRLLEHNSNKYDDGFTSRGIPWELFLLIEELSSSQAYRMERHIKSMKSSRYIKTLKSNPKKMDELKEKYKD